MIASGYNLTITANGKDFLSLVKSKKITGIGSESNRYRFLLDSIQFTKKALEEDKPSWIQLIDKEGIVSKSYVANMIPKFILIDKQGNIVSFDAPGPGSVEIEKLLNEEIIK